MSTKTPLLSEVIAGAIASSLDRVRVALPGRIQEYADGRATVQPSVMDEWIDESGERQVTALNPLTDVPVLRVGSDASRVKFPIGVGDEVLLLFASSSIAAWKSASRAAPVDPRDGRRHHISDAVALTGLTSGPGGDAVTLIDISDESLKLGSSAAVEPGLLGQTFLTQLGVLITAIGTAVGTIPTGGSAAGAAIESALLVFQGASATYVSQKVKLV